MSLKQFYLSSQKYGYSLSASTTQQSVNSTMKAYLSALTQPLVTVVYVADDYGNPLQITYEELLLRSDGADPFTIPGNANPNTNPEIKKLEGARFMVGFKARIGLPPKYLPSDIPDIVTFSLSTSSVVFRLLCAEFTVVSYKPTSGYSPASWFNASQGDQEAWIFESVVNLEQIAVGSEKYYLLPPDVQEAIAKFHAGTFGVQQLLLNMDNAALQTVPQIKGVEPGSVLYNVLTQYFIGTYFTQLQRDGQPVLGCTITRIEPDVSTVNITDVRMQVGPWVDELGQIVANPTEEQKRLSTLNYLCMTENRTPLPPVPFGWNALTASDAADGVIALNRDVFAQFLKDQMYYQIQRNCYKPYVRVWQDWIWSKGGWVVLYEFSLTPYQTPSITFPSNGSRVMQANYHSETNDQAGAGGSLGRMELSSSFDVTIDFSGNQIVVVQYLKIYTYLRVLATSAGGNVVDVKITNTFTLGVNAKGQLTSVVTTNREDKSDLPSANGFLNFFADVNSLRAKVETCIGEMANASFKDMPLSVVQSLVFPGGNTFSFKDVTFSDHQDLVSRVIYADPVKNLRLTESKHSANFANGTFIALKDYPAELPRPLMIELRKR